MKTNTNSFMKSLFMGQIQEDLIFPFPVPTADEVETIQMIIDSFSKFVEQHVEAEKWDKQGFMPKEILTHLSEMGVMGLAVPEEYGGLGLRQGAYARILQEVSCADGGLAVTLGAHQSIGYKALLLFGSDEQKKRFLPRLATGELIACFCLTEPGSGSDAASISTRAKLSDDGKHYVINGSKLWITNAEVASFMTVFAKTEIEIDGVKKDRISCFMIELPTEGVKVGPKEDKMGIRSSWTNEIFFEDVKVPAENLIGQLGDGFKVAMGVLNSGRLGLAGGCLGGMKSCLKMSIEHANERVQFGKKLAEFGIIQEKLARMASDIFAGEAMAFITASLVDKGGVDYSVEGAIAKIFVSDMVWRAADENIQIWGGAGFMKEYPHERWLRDTRINRIFEGTNEILHLFIALSGFDGPGKELGELAKSMKNPVSCAVPLGMYVGKKALRRFYGPKITKAHPALRKMCRAFEKYTYELVRDADYLVRKHKKKIIEKQMVQKRIATVAIDLYAIICVISRLTHILNKKGGPDNCKFEMDLAEIFFTYANRRLRGNFKALRRHVDRNMDYISGELCEKGKYPLDWLDI